MEDLLFINELEELRLQKYNTIKKSIEQECPTLGILTDEILDTETEKGKSLIPLSFDVYTKLSIIVGYDGHYHIKYPDGSMSRGHIPFDKSENVVESVKKFFNVSDNELKATAVEEEPIENVAITDSNGILTPDEIDRLQDELDKWTDEITENVTTETKDEVAEFANTLPEYFGEQAKENEVIPDYIGDYLKEHNLSIDDLKEFTNATTDEQVVHLVEDLKEDGMLESLVTTIKSKNN